MNTKFIDLHEDIINLFKLVDINNITKVPFDSSNNDFQVNIPYMKRSNTKLIFSTSFGRYSSRPSVGLSSFELILYTLYLNKKIINTYNVFEEILDNKGINNLMSNKKIGIINHLEGLYGINDFWQIDLLYDLGIRSIGVIWNDESNLSTSCKTKNSYGLTEKGKEIIKYINKKNMILDLAHISDKAFEEVCQIYDKPLMVSHTAVRALNNCDRNITNDQLILIKNNGGLVGINFSTLFLNGSFEGEIKDVIDHVKYTIDIVGIDHVGIGTDFEGIGKNISPNNLKSLNDIENLESELKKDGFSNSDIEKILYKNALNFIKTSLN